MIVPTPRITAFVQSQEVLLLDQTPLPDGTIYVGWGHLVQPTDGLPSRISTSQALNLLTADLQTLAGCLNAAVTVPLTAGQATALMDFVYNVGCQAFNRSLFPSTLALADFGKAATLFLQYVTNANDLAIFGVAGRRQAEAAQFIS